MASDMKKFFFVAGVLGLGYFAYTRLQLKPEYRKSLANVKDGCDGIVVEDYDSFMGEYKRLYKEKKERSGIPQFVAYQVSSELLGPDCADYSPVTGFEPTNKNQAALNSAVYKKVYEDLKADHRISDEVYDKAMDEVLSYAAQQGVAPHDIDEVFAELENGAFP